MKKSPLEINFTDAFETGKIEGGREALEDILKYAEVVDKNLEIYIKAKLSNIDDKYSLIRRLNIYRVK